MTMPERKKPNPLRGVELNEKGIFSRSEFAMFVFQRLTEETLDEFLRGCPEDALLQLQEAASVCPADSDDEGWAKGRVGWAGYPDPQFTAEEHAQFDDELQLNYREGVRLIRTSIKS